MNTAKLLKHDTYKNNENNVPKKRKIIKKFKKQEDHYQTESTELAKFIQRQRHFGCNNV